MKIIFLSTLILSEQFLFYNIGRIRFTSRFTQLNFILFQALSLRYCAVEEKNFHDYITVKSSFPQYLL